MTDQAEELLALLRHRGLHLAVAESLTGGALSAALVTVPGASDVFRGAVIAYATPVKQTLLGVDARLLAERGPVDGEVARQMARGARKALTVEGGEAEVGVSTTGVAGPTMQDGAPIGTVHIGVSRGDRQESRAFRFEGDRAAIRAEAVSAALSYLREWISEDGE
ncbi:MULTISPECIES: CinA family protein [Bacteria]|uniref:CinA family protein n=1 Tax=Bacteria TaxID=2 RepID=UPI003C7D2166